ncbi:hypothetical protein TNCV_206741 [Trichonephila clavipes]|nr:hypothetical protein TNCV_206741 [Trichonephila clavipes]
MTLTIAQQILLLRVIQCPIIPFDSIGNKWNVRKRPLLRLLLNTGVCATNREMNGGHGQRNRTTVCLLTNPTSSSCNIMIGRFSMWKHRGIRFYHLTLLAAEWNVRKESIASFTIDWKTARFCANGAMNDGHGHWNGTTLLLLKNIASACKIRMVGFEFGDTVVNAATMGGYQDLSEFECVVIAGEREMGHSTAEVAMKFGFSRTTISRV